MTLSQIIEHRTNNGLEIVDFLVEVMHDRYEDFQICHRLQAAKLLTTYGNEDAPSFIDDNTTDSSSNTRKRKPRRPTRFDTELARVIREDTDDGRSIARFLTNVMVGELTSFRPHHRMSAARELLDRGFGKSARNEKIAHPVENPRRREPTEGPDPVPAARPEPVEGPKPTDEQTLTPHSSALTHGREDQSWDTLTPQDNEYWLGIYDSPMYEFMCECEHPDFDPFLAAVDEDYFQSFTDCTDPECEVHGDPPDFDPNDYHY